MTEPLDIDLGRCEQLAKSAADGDTAAWTALVEQLWPVLQRLVRLSRSMGSLGRSEDHVRDVLTGVLAKLGGTDGRGLKLYGSWRERHTDKSFADWIRIVTKNVMRDHMREELGEFKQGGIAKDPSVKRVLNEFAGLAVWEKLGTRPPMTAAQTARQLLDFARARLPMNQYETLTRWIDGASFEDIQTDLDLPSPEDGRKLLRAAVAALRRHFATAHNST